MNVSAPKSPIIGVLRSVVKFGGNDVPWMMHSRRLVLNQTERPNGDHQEIVLPCFHLSEQVQQKTLWLERINLLISSQFQ